MDNIVGYVDHIVFYNENNHYTVMDMECNGELVTVVGNFPALKRGEYLSISGQWTEHPTFGTQFKAQNFEITAPSTTEGLKRYLSSGIITGIGEKKAKLLIEHFGEDVVDIIRYNPQRLTEIPGIGEKTAETISESFNENREVMETIVYLSNFGISSTYAMRIYKVYKNNSINIIKENPYQIISDVPGMGFKTADAIAMSVGIERDSTFRVMAGVNYALGSCYRDGHVYLSEDVLIQKASSLLMVEKELVEHQIGELILKGEIKLQIIDEERVYYSAALFKAEENVANTLVRLNNYEYEKERIDIDNVIGKFQKENEIEIDPVQVEAIKAAVQNGIIIITGGPGTGKTTIINCILDIFKRLNYEVALAAPTGRAAKRMSESTGEKATTIHRLLEYGFSSDEASQSFEKNEENPLEYDVIIIDEASMIDTVLMNSLLKAVSIGTRIIFVGDVNQLPSVGPGNVLKDLIDSKLLRVVKLTKIFRQAQESMIVVNAHRINNGEMPVLNDKEKDFFFIEGFTGDKVKTKIVNLCTNRLKQYNFMEDVQVIAPIKKGPTGILELNSALQESVNPANKIKKEKAVGSVTFREGDKIMQIKNNYQKEWDLIEGGESGKGIFNGDMGIIEKIYLENKKLVAIFDHDKRVVYDFEELDEIMHAYAITVHKSQGSEFPVVIMPIFKGPSILLNRNLFYTAITRAKALVILVGNIQYLPPMIQNTNSVKRNTGLRQRIESSPFLEIEHVDS